MDIKLLEQVRDRILEEPKRFDMFSWISDPGDPENSEVKIKTLTQQCNTTGCIAGWTCVVSGKTRGTAEDVQLRAQRLLKLRGDQADRLFYDWYWPGQYGDAYEKAKTPKQKAKVAARRINHFIKTNGAE